MFHSTPARHLTHTCPLNSGKTCDHCIPGVTGPDDCGLVHQLLEDPELLASYRRFMRSVELHRASATAKIS